MDTTTTRPSMDEPGVDGIRVRCAGRTAVGLVRDHNEDNLVVADLTRAQRCPLATVEEYAVGDRGMLLAVCDGVGGSAAGEIASQMAVDVLFESLSSGEPPEDRDELARHLVAAIERAGESIFEAAIAERQHRGMGSTATAAALIDELLFVGEIGDSRAYLLRQGVLKQITKDQSLVSQLIDAGHLTEEEAESFEHSNIILQALGSKGPISVDLTFVELRRGDRLLLCSDGLSGMARDDAIREVMMAFEDPDECASKLIELAEAGGGNDNITVIVADFDGDALAEPVDADTVAYVQYPLMPTEADDVHDELANRDTEPSEEAREPGESPPPDTTAKRSGPRGWLIATLLAMAAGAYAMNLAPCDGGADIRAED